MKFKLPVGSWLYIIQSKKEKKLKLMICALVALALSGCATTSNDISSVYVSPLQYNSYDCEQLVMEGQRIQVRAGQMGARIDQSASNGNLATAAAVVIFWPAAFFTGGGNKEQQAEFARLKGEKEALDQAMIAKKCHKIVASATS